MESQTPAYKKQITIVSLNTKTISPRQGGRSFQPFNVYLIGGNDGIVYETTMSDWYSKRKVGEIININYVVETTIGANSEVYSHYKLLIPKTINTSNTEQTTEALRKIYSKISDVEKNILSRLEIISLPNAQFVGPKDVPEINLDEEDEINAELDEISSEDIEINKEESEQPELPF